MAKRRVNDLTPVEFADIKRLAIDSLLVNYGAYFIREQFEEASARVKYLTAEEIETKYSSHNKGASGFYCSGGNTEGDIVIKRSAHESAAYMVSVSCHEILHGVSSENHFSGVADNDADTILQITVSGKHKRAVVKKNIGLNEGITEWLASENMKTLTDPWFHISYQKQVEVVRHLSRLCGKDGILFMYINHNTSPLDRLLGPEKAKIFLRKMDELYVYMRMNIPEDAERLTNELHKILNGSGKVKKQSWFSDLVLRGKPGFTDEEQWKFSREVLERQRKSKLTSSANGSNDEFVRTLWNEQGGREGR